MIDSIEFAKYIINRVLERNRSAGTSLELGATKLQKLIYICDGCLLAIGENAIGENVKAWKYGPVYPKTIKWLYKNPGVFIKIRALKKPGNPASPIRLPR